MRSMGSLTSGYVLCVALHVLELQRTIRTEVIFPDSLRLTALLPVVFPSFFIYVITLVIIM